MNPEKPDESLPHDAGPELRKRTAEVDNTLNRIEDEIKQIESDVKKIEDVEQKMRADHLM
jgi:hypothetical protein